MPTQTRRKVDQASTLTAYTNRLLSLRREIFEPIRGYSLSSYDVLDSFTRYQHIEDELEPRRFTKLDNSVLVLFQVCVMRGVNVLGITSERLVKCKHIAAVPIECGRAMCDIIYCGNRNAFGNKKNTRYSVFWRKTNDMYVKKIMLNNSNKI